MSTSINAYLSKHVKDLSPIDKLCTSIYNRTKKNKINPKQQLTYLRELTIQVVANSTLDETFITGLIEQMKDFLDQDGDRKLLRIYLFVILEVLSKESKSVDQFKMTEIINFMTKEANSRTNTRQFLAFRTLGILYSLNKANQVNESSNESIFRLMTSSLSGLKYAGKQKKSMFSGGDKDYMLRSLHWTSIMSSLQFTGRVIPKECYANLFYGVLSQHTPLVRSSLMVLLNTVSQLRDDEQSVLELCSMLLDRYRKGKEYLNLEDPLCAAYFLRIIGALGHSVNWRNAECKARVLDLFLVAVEFFKSKSVKVVCETVSLFVDHSYSWSILVMLLHERTAPRIVPQMVDALSEHIKTTPYESIGMPLMYRTCVKLGRFLISRPAPHGVSDTKNLLSAQHTERDGETLIPLWLALKKHHYKPLLLPCALPSNLSSLIAADVISTANESSYYACGENARVGSPHMLCEAMKAFIWLAPDKRYCKKEHRQLWAAFAGNLAETVRALAATPLCGDELLEGLLSHLYARVRASMLVAPRAVHHDVHTTTTASTTNTSKGGDVDLLFDASEDFTRSGGGGSLPAAHTLHYEPMYVDLLLSVAESVMTASQPTNRSLTYIQNLWSFVALLANSTSVHETASALPAVSVKASEKSVDLNNLLSMDFSDVTSSSSSSGVLSGSAAQEEAYKAHVRYALLRSILSVLEFTKRGVAVQPSQQILLSIHTSALWHLAEHALLWRDVSNVDEYLQTKGIVKAVLAITVAPPVADMFGSSTFSSSTFSSSSSSSVTDHKHSALSVVISLLSEACGGGEGTLKKVGLQGLIKVCNSLYLTAATSGSHRSFVADSALDIYVHTQLVHELVRLFLVHFNHTMTAEGRSALQSVLTGGQSSGGGQFLKTFLSFVRMYPQDTRSRETVGDVWKASVDKGESGGVLGLLLGSTLRGSSVLYVSLVSSLLILFEYTTHIGLVSPSGRAVATITPMAPRKASLLIPEISGMEEAPPLTATETISNKEAEEEQQQEVAQDDGYNFDFSPSQPQVQIQTADDDFSFSSFDSTPAAAVTAPAKINIPSVKGVSNNSKLKAPPPQIKTAHGKSVASIASTPSATDDNMFDWPASTTSSAAPLSSTTAETPSAFSGWDDAPLSTASQGVADTSFASTVDSSASFGWGVEVAPSSVKDAFQAPSTVESGAWGAGVSTIKDVEFGSDSFASTSFAPSAAPSAGDNDLFSFPTTNKTSVSTAQSASFGASETAASHWASSVPPVSTKPVAAVPLLSKPVVPTLSAPKKITPLKKGGGVNNTSSAVLTPSGSGGDLFGSTVLTPSSTTGSIMSDWGAIAPVQSVALSGFAPSGGSDDFLDSFASTTSITTSATALAPPVFASSSIGTVSGYGDDFGSFPAASSEASANSGYGGEQAYDFSAPVIAAPVLQPVMSSFNLAPVAPSQPAKDLISDLFGEGAASDVALPQMMPLGVATSATTSVPAANKTPVVSAVPVSGFASGDLFGGGDDLFPAVTAAPTAATTSSNSSAYGGDLFGAPLLSVASSQQSTPPVKTVPLLAKPTALATAKARASALKRTPSISSVGSGSVLSAAGGDDFDIFSTPSTTAPPTGAPGRVARSTSISSVASHESSQSQQSVFSVQSHQSAAFPIATNTTHFGAADTDLFGSSTTTKTTHSASSANMFEDNGWGASTTAPVVRPNVPVLSKPVVPTLTKPSGPAVKINPFAAPVAAGATNVTAKAKAAAAAAAARRGSVATSSTGGIHGDLMNLDMPVLAAPDAAPVAASSSGWPSATPAPAARSSFTSPPVDPFASSHNFTAPVAVAVAAPTAVDSFSASTDFAPSSATDSFAPSTAGTAAAGWGGAAAPGGFTPQAAAAYGQQYAQPAAYQYGYGAPVAPAYDPVAAAANAAYYAQQQAYAADPQYAAYYAQQAAAGGYPPQQQYGQQQQQSQYVQYPPQQQGQYGGYQYPPQGQQQTPAAPGQQQQGQGQYPANFGYSAYVPK